METKIVYVLASTPDDYYLEQCLVSVLSVRHYMPYAHIVLLVDDLTQVFLTNERAEIVGLVTELKTVCFSDSTSQIERSRLMKINLRSHIVGQYLYLDCDTIITKELVELDELTPSIAAVLDGHCPLKEHPMLSYFSNQNRILDYDFYAVTKYFSGGVIFAKDDEIAHSLYKKWNENYQESANKGMFLDEPSLSKSNHELGNVISEIDGTWNCQIRFGAMYLSDAKILHFCSKRNMPVSTLSSKSFLYQVRLHGIATQDLELYIKDWRLSMPNSMILTFGEDMKYNLTKKYETHRTTFCQENLLNSIYIKKTSKFKELFDVIRNRIIGYFLPKGLSRILYRESFGREIRKDGMVLDFNEKIHKLVFYTDTSSWSAMSDKIAVRKYIVEKELSDILPVLYDTWDYADDMDFSALPECFVLKCNHDNGSSMVIRDKYSVDMDYIRKYYKNRLNKKFGIETAEPYYRNITPLVFAEECIKNDTLFSDSLVNYRFFSFNGSVEYCQVVYDCTNYKQQKTNIISVANWKICRGYILDREGEIDIPQPQCLDKMLEIVKVLSSSIIFCRVDLYEYHGRVYFSEMTFMPGCGRIKNFHQLFLDELGRKITLK